MCLSRFRATTDHMFCLLPAYKASSYLEQLLDKGAIVPQDSAELNDIYTRYAPPPPSDEPTSKQTEDIDSDASSTPAPDPSKAQHEHLLLTRDAVTPITEVFDPRPHSSLAADLYRALQQAALRLQNPDSSSNR